MPLLGLGDRPRSDEGATILSILSERPIVHSEMGPILSSLRSDTEKLLKTVEQREKEIVDPNAPASAATLDLLSQFSALHAQYEARVPQIEAETRKLQDEINATKTYFLFLERLAQTNEATQEKDTQPAQEPVIQMCDGDEEEFPDVVPAPSRDPSPSSSPSSSKRRLDLQTILATKDSDSPPLKPTQLPDTKAVTPTLVSPSSSTVDSTSVSTTQKSSPKQSPKLPSYSIRRKHEMVSATASEARGSGPCETHFFFDFLRCLCGCYSAQQCAC